MSEVKKKPPTDDEAFKFLCLSSLTFGPKTLEAITEALLRSLPDEEGAGDDENPTT